MLEYNKKLNQDDEILKNWMKCEYDDVFLACIICNRLSARRHVLTGRACPCGGGGGSSS